jgi:hypothetical protein
VLSITGTETDHRRCSQTAVSRYLERRTADNISDIFKTGWKQYHHIIWEKPFQTQQLSIKDIQELYSHLTDNGSLFMRMDAKNAKVE